MGKIRKILFFDLIFLTFPILDVKFWFCLLRMEN
jgi:hypothetical protein